MIRSLNRVFAMSYQLTAMSLIWRSPTAAGKMDTTNKVTFPLKTFLPRPAKACPEKIYFCHQSVGQNIDSINDVMKQNTQINLNIVDLPKLPGFNKHFLLIQMLGK